MKQAHKLKSTSGSNHLRDQVTYKQNKTITISKDHWLGVCLDDYLFKLCGTDQMVWIPKNMLNLSLFREHAFDIIISCDALYCCAKLKISNSIRMCLVEQHQVKGSQLLSYLEKS